MKEHVMSPGQLLSQNASRQGVPVAIRMVVIVEIEITPLQAVSEVLQRIQKGDVLLPAKTREAIVGGGQLSFVDLAVETGIESADGRRYQYQMLRDGKVLGEAVEMSGADPIGLPAGEARMVEVRVRNRRGDGNWAGWVSVYVESSPISGEYTLVAVGRPD